MKTNYLSVALLLALSLCSTGCKFVPLLPAHPESSGEYEIDSGHSSVIFQIPPLTKP